MIELIFELGNEVILVLINGNKVTFGNTSYGAQMADISGLQLNYEGVVREHPDLELRNDWQEEAVSRFKDKIRSLENENLNPNLQLHPKF